MPPKPKCTKEQIVKAALKLVSERGEKALTARELGKNSAVRLVLFLLRWEVWTSLSKKSKKKACEFLAIILLKDKIIRRSLKPSV